MPKKTEEKSGNQFLFHWNTFWWYAFSISARGLLIFLPAINLIDLINSGATSLLLKIIFQLLRLLLGIFLIYNVFVLPGTNNIYIPTPQIASNQSRTYLMYWGVGSAMYLSLLIKELENYLLSHLSPSLSWEIHVIGLGSLFLLFGSLHKNRRTLKSVSESQIQKNLFILGKATQKVSENLTYKERVELENLLLTEKDFNSNAINNLGRLLWQAIVVALILAVVQEILERVYTGIVK